MNRHTQRGMTMWGTMFVVFVAVFFIFLFFKLFPVYMEDFKIKNAMNGLAQEAAGGMTRAQMMERLARRFDVDNVDANPVQLTVEAQGRTRVIRFQYEVVVPLAYNVSALIEFDHARQIGAGE